jgi:hypothetical protein
MGIGAKASLVSAVDVFMLRPLSYDEADRLTHGYSTAPARGWSFNSVSIPDFIDLRKQSQTMGIATYFPARHATKMHPVNTLTSG